MEVANIRLKGKGSVMSLPVSGAFTPASPQQRAVDDMVHSKWNQKPSSSSRRKQAHSDLIQGRTRAGGVRGVQFDFYRIESVHSSKTSNDSITSTALVFVLQERFLTESVHCIRNCCLRGWKGHRGLIAEGERDAEQTKVHIHL